MFMYILQIITLIYEIGLQYMYFHIKGINCVMRVTSRLITTARTRAQTTTRTYPVPTWEPEHVNTEQPK